MKKFVIKLILLSLPLILYFFIKPYFLLLDDKYKSKVAGSDIYISIRKSKEKQHHKKIIIGDSVGRQIFPNEGQNDTINSLACNQAIGMVGHYLLLRNYLEAGNTIESAFLIYTPFSFKNNLDQVYTFNYFLKPFFKSEYKESFTKTVYQQIDKIPSWKLSQVPYILTSNWAPNFICNDSVDYTFLSPISTEYLIKIRNLSRKYNFKFTILPTPTKQSNKLSIERINKDEIVKNDLSSIFENYFENIYFFDDSCFMDNEHLWNPDDYRYLYDRLFD